MLQVLSGYDKQCSGYFVKMGSLCGTLSLLILTGCRALPARIDTVPPTITVRGVIDGQRYNSGTVLSPTIVIKDNTDPHPQVSIELNGKPYSVGTPIRSHGEYFLRIKASDKHGNKTSRFIFFQISEHKYTSTTVETVAWLYKPHQNGYAELKAELVITSDRYPLEKLSCTSLGLDVYIKSEKDMEWYVLDADAVYFLKDRSTKKVVAVRVVFHQYPQNHKVKAGVLFRDWEKPRLIGAFDLGKEVVFFDEPIQVVGNSEILQKYRNTTYEVLIYRRQRP